MLLRKFLNLSILKTCIVYKLDTTNRHHRNVPSDPIELTDMPFSHIALDYVTHFDTSHNGKGPHTRQRFSTATAICSQIAVAFAVDCCFCC